jgi:hypothetical protein
MVTARPPFVDHFELNLAVCKLKTEHHILSNERKWEDWAMGPNGIVTTGELIDVAGMSCMGRGVGVWIRLFCVYST